MTSLEVVKSFYREMARGDVSAAFGLLDSAVKWLEAEIGHLLRRNMGRTGGGQKNLFDKVPVDWDFFAITPESFGKSPPCRTVDRNPWAGHRLVLVIVIHGGRRDRREFERPQLHPHRHLLPLA
jgi:hypothetical protein